MKAVMKRVLCLPIPALLVTVVLSEAAEAKKAVPFKGTIRAVEDSIAVFPPDVPFPTLFVEASGSGHATHLGKFTVNYEVEVNLDTFFGIGSSEFIAANGDSLFAEGEGQGTVPDENGISFIVEVNTIIGGTGRFAGASGRFVIVRVINVNTGVTFGVLGGTIVLD
jgi:hypothetical protein